jgi:hypothetical protein
MPAESRSSVVVSLQHKLQELNSTVVDVPQDGYCLLNSVHQVLARNGTADMSVSIIKTKLREESMTHFSHYESFLCAPTTCSSKEIFQNDLQLYLCSGVYDTDAGDLVIPLLCNALGITIVVFEQQETLTEITQKTQKTHLYN